KSLVATSPNVALLFLPAAEAFRGRVDLRMPAEVDVDVEAGGMQPVTDGSSTAVDRSTQDAAAVVVRAWNYESQAASLQFRIDGGEVTSHSSLRALVELQTVLAAGGHDADRHRAVFRIMTDSAPSPI